MKFWIISSFLILPILLIAQGESLDVENAIKIGNYTNHAPQAGTIRWTGLDFEGWNGHKWVSMTAGVTAPITDIDGNVYRTMRIGDQTWMAENLKTTRLNDGGSISLEFDNASWQSSTSASYSFYEEDADLQASYGNFYNGYAVEQVSCVLPDGKFLRKMIGMF